MELLTELFDDIRNNPGMYIGARTITGLKAFVDGWLASRESVVSPGDFVEQQFFELFQTWIEEKYHCDATASWARIIGFHASDEYEALETCLDELVEFRDHHFNA